MPEAGITFTTGGSATLQFRCGLLIAGWQAASLTDPPSLHPDWLPSVLGVLREAGLSIDPALTEPLRVLAGEDVARHCRALLALHERSGSPEHIPDTPAGRMWLRGAVKILQEVARAGL